MTLLVEHPLGDAGVAFVIDWLGGHGLAGSLADVVAEKRGYTYAPFPAQTSTERALAFEMGTRFPERHRRAWLSKHLRALPRGLVIFQDLWMLPDNVHDSPVIQVDERRVLAENAVYYCCRTDEATEPLIEDIYRAICSFCFAAYYASGLDEETFRNTTAAVIAPMVSEVFVSAYDQEGFVVWRG